MTILQQYITLNKNYKFQAKNNNIKIIKRFMFKSTINHSTRVLRPITFQGFSRQNYPGKYELVRPRKTLTADEKRRLNLTQHETTHDNIRDTKTKKLEGIFTSAQNKENNSPVIFDKIDPIKKNGTFTPLKDKAGVILYDEHGYEIPDPKKGGQWMATFPQARKLNKDVEHLYEIDKNAQSYVDTHEDTIENNIDKNRKKYGLTTTKQIGGQDDEGLQ